MKGAITNHMNGYMDVLFSNSRTKATHTAAKLELQKCLAYSKQYRKIHVHKGALSFWYVFTLLQLAATYDDFTMSLAVLCNISFHFCT